MVVTMTLGLNTYGKMKLIVQSTELLAKESENAFIPDKYEWPRPLVVHDIPSNDRRPTMVHEDIKNLFTLSKKASDMRNIANKTAIEFVAYDSSSKFKILENNINLINNQLQNMNKHISNLENDFIEFKTLIIEEQKSLIQLEEAKNNLNKYTNYSFIEIIYWIVFLVSHILVIEFLLIVIHELTHYFKTSIAISNI